MYQKDQKNPKEYAMKKLIIALLCAILMCAMLQPAVFAASDSIEITISGRQTSLMFDRSEQFSYVSGGLAQACFYGYMEGTNDLYELYMIFPWSVQAGTVIDQIYALQFAPDTTVLMVVTKETRANYYFAGQADDDNGTSYVMTFESVSDSDAGRTFTGTLSANMIGVADDFETEVPPVSFKNARFSFTMPNNTDSEPAPDESMPPIEDDPFGDGVDPFAEPVPSPTPEIYLA